MSATAARKATSPEVHPLAMIEWDFPNRTWQNPVEAIHPYPARFVAELPRALLSVLPVPAGSAVLDPFCGSGTTLVEAQRRGLPSVGIDINPIACLMTRVKTSALPPDLDEVANATAVLAGAERNPPIPEIPRIDHWFNADVQKALAALAGAITGAPAAHRDALRLALSSIIDRVSKHGAGARCAPLERDVTAAQVVAEFVRAAGRIHRALVERDYSLPAGTVIEADTLAFDPARIGRRIGMIITSPPYPNVYDYWRCHEHRMHWLGFDPREVRAREVGARSHFRRRRDQSRRKFAGQMYQTFRWVREVLVQDGYVCAVIGRSRIQGQVVDNTEIMEQAAQANGFELVYATRRSLPPRRKPFNGPDAGNRTERVLVWTRRAVSCLARAAAAGARS